MGKKCSWIRKSIGSYGSESTIYCAAPPKPKLSLAERLRLARIRINSSQSKSNPKKLN